MIRYTGGAGLIASDLASSNYAARWNEANKNSLRYKVKKHRSTIFLSLIVLNLFFAVIWLLNERFNDNEYDYADHHRNSYQKTPSANDSASATKPRKVRERDIKDLYHFLTTYHKENYANERIYLHQVPKILPEHTNTESVQWQFNLKISNLALYSEADADLVDRLVNSMAYQPIVHLEQDDRTGTELKIIATFADGTVALMKPQRMKRDEEVNPNLFVFSEYERHHSEIAAHHLDRILGFNHVPPCTGRLLNVTSDIEPYIDDQFVATIHKSPAGNTCFYGKCMFFCDVHHPYCGDPDVVEVSACTYLPFKWWQSYPLISPWRRSYNKHKIADWQLKHINASYCHKLMDIEGMYRTGHRLLDVLDMSIFDFLTGNIDRHHYDFLMDFGENSSLILFDNGRGFGRHKHDDLSIIAGLHQCCMIRKSTYDKLLRIQQGKVKLSDLMRWHMKDDPIGKRAPVLAEQHLEALDRRVDTVLEIVHKDCLKNKKLHREEVILDDLL